MNAYHHRHLPHWQPGGQVFFVTFRLFGPLPRDVAARLKQEARMLRKQPARPNETPRERALREAKRLFGLVDEALADQIRSGGDRFPFWLSNLSVAEMVQEAIHHRDGKVFLLHRYVIMPNHVHLLMEPLPVGQVGNLSKTTPSLSRQKVDAPSYARLSTILHSLERYTARHANQLLGRAGVFWQDESYDHWVRDEDEYHRIVWYIDRNPVKAGLCKSPEEWTWSTAGESTRSGR